ncbi:CDP-alcohol phosphatidyltransferase family protein [Yimella sp. RIT 621]|uniref:CDP-alcohol phosphatidyltransferase family protein n=1 Tax=unclassified Yimella TaxID=2649892 RepID=UPI00197A981A|nr:CDP-alcohol phosphatidyltransferase family protein [Yimella sp. RIT 621]MCG8655422.1 CDP-alcohol phosphatidyltransferase family protein [Yimella sp. NH-Cas1]
MTTAEVSNRIWTVPNALSLLRLLGVPLFFWLILAEYDWWALAVLMIAGFTDYLDGKLARMLGQTSKLGQMLDPAADRLYILATILALAMRDIIPWWLVWILLARELFILCLGPILQRHRLPLPPVSFIGKSATFNLIYAFPLVLLGEQAGAVGDVARPLGWAFVWWGTALYWVAGIMYAVQVRQMVRDSRDAPQSARS